MINHQQFGTPYGYEPVNMGTGYQFMGQQQQTLYKSNYTPEEYNRLINESTAFTLYPTEDEILTAKCNHRSLTGLDKDEPIIDLPDGRCQCKVCKYIFRPVDYNEDIDAIQDASDRVVDILQTIKMIYFNMPQATMEQFWIVIPLIKKIPHLFQMAVDDFNKSSGQLNYRYNNRNLGTFDLYSRFIGSIGGMMGAPGMMGGYYGQQMPQQPQYTAGPNPGVMGGQPMYGQQPMMGAFGTPMYNQQAYGYQPNNTGFAYNPAQQQPIAQPQAAAPAEPAADSKASDDTAKKNFKA